jgi:hypothetical protein
MTHRPPGIKPGMNCGQYSSVLWLNAYLAFRNRRANWYDPCPIWTSLAHPNLAYRRTPDFCWNNHDHGAPQHWCEVPTARSDLVSYRLPSALYSYRYNQVATPVIASLSELPFEKSSWSWDDCMPVLMQASLTVFWQYFRNACWTCRFQDGSGVRPAN